MSDTVDLNSFGQNARATLMGAAVEAQRRGLDVAEAEHLLLALAAESLSPVGRLLADVGLDHAGSTEALRIERERSLRLAGVDPSASAGLTATRLPASRPRWGASLREAILRGSKEARSSGRRERRAWRPIDLLIGLLSLEVGTVPRALVYAGIDKEALVARARTLGATPSDVDPSG